MRGLSLPVMIIAIAILLGSALISKSLLDYYTSLKEAESPVKLYEVEDISYGGYVMYSKALSFLFHFPMLFYASHGFYYGLRENYTNISHLATLPVDIVYFWQNYSNFYIPTDKDVIKNYTKIVNVFLLSPFYRSFIMDYLQDYLSRYPKSVSLEELRDILDKLSYITGVEILSYEKQDYENIYQFSDRPWDIYLRLHTLSPDVNRFSYYTEVEGIPVSKVLFFPTEVVIKSNLLKMKKYAELFLKNREFKRYLDWVLNYYGLLTMFSPGIKCKKVVLPIFGPYIGLAYSLLTLIYDQYHPILGLPACVVKGNYSNLKEEIDKYSSEIPEELRKILFVDGENIVDYFLNNNCKDRLETANSTFYFAFGKFTTCAGLCYNDTSCTKSVITKKILPYTYNLTKDLRDLVKYIVDTAELYYRNETIIFEKKKIALGAIEDFSYTKYNVTFFVKDSPYCNHIYINCSNPLGISGDNICSLKIYQDTTLSKYFLKFYLGIHIHTGKDWIRNIIIEFNGKNTTYSINKNYVNEIHLNITVEIDNSTFSDVFYESDVREYFNNHPIVIYLSNSNEIFDKIVITGENLNFDVNNPIFFKEKEITASATYEVTCVYSCPLYECKCSKSVPVCFDNSCLPPFSISCYTGSWNCMCLTVSPIIRGGFEQYLCSCSGCYLLDPSKCSASGWNCNAVQTSNYVTLTKNYVSSSCSSQICENNLPYSSCKVSSYSCNEISRTCSESYVISQDNYLITIVDSVYEVSKENIVNNILNFKCPYDCFENGWINNKCDSKNDTYYSLCGLDADIPGVGLKIYKEIYVSDEGINIYCENCDYDTNINILYINDSSFTIEYVPGELYPNSSFILSFFYEDFYNSGGYAIDYLLPSEYSNYDNFTVTLVSVTLSEPINISEIEKKHDFSEISIIKKGGTLVVKKIYVITDNYNNVIRFNGSRIVYVFYPLYKDIKEYVENKVKEEKNRLDEMKALVEDFVGELKESGFSTADEIENIFLTWINLLNDSLDYFLSEFYNYEDWIKYAINKNYTKVAEILLEKYQDSLDYIISNTQDIVIPICLSLMKKSITIPADKLFFDIEPYLLQYGIVFFLNGAPVCNISAGSWFYCFSDEIDSCGCVYCSNSSYISPYYAEFFGKSKEYSTFVINETVYNSYYKTAINSIDGESLITSCYKVYGNSTNCYEATIHYINKLFELFWKVFNRMASSRFTRTTAFKVKLYPVDFRYKWGICNITLVDPEKYYNPLYYPVGLKLIVGFRDNYTAESPICR